MRLYLDDGRFVYTLDLQPSLSFLCAWPADIMTGMADVSVRCEACGKETGGKKFCPYCGAPSTTETPETPKAPTPPGRGEVSPPTDLEGPPLLAPPRPAKRTGLVVAILVVALLCAGGVVAAVLFLVGGGASITIQSPSSGSSVDGNSVTVKLAVSGADKVAIVDVFLDSKKRATVNSAPYQVKLSSIENGKHTLEATASDANGAVLAKASATFTSNGKIEKPNDGGTQSGQDKSKEYKTALASKINEASALNDRITKDAERVNTEVNFNARIVPTPLMAELRALTTSANSLVSSVAALAPTDDIKDVQSQFATLCDYLRVRAGALLNGAEAVENGGDYTSEFSAGGQAKTSFDAAWPQFLTTCKSRGVPV